MEYVQDGAVLNRNAYSKKWGSDSMGLTSEEP